MFQGRSSWPETTSGEERGKRWLESQLSLATRSRVCTSTMLRAAACRLRISEPLAGAPIQRSMLQRIQRGLSRRSCPFQPRFFSFGRKKRERERERETELEDVTRLQRLDHRLLSRFPVPEEASKLYTNLTRRRVCAPRGTEFVSGTPAGPFCHMNDHPFFFKTFSPFPPRNSPP